MQPQDCADDNDRSEKQPGARRRKVGGPDRSVSHSRLTDLVESKLVLSKFLTLEPMTEGAERAYKVKRAGWAERGSCTKPYTMKPGLPMRRRKAQHAEAFRHCPEWDGAFGGKVSF